MSGLTRRHFAAVLASPAMAANLPNIVTVRATHTAPPPDWALLERKLIRAMSEAAPIYRKALTYRGGALRKGGKVDDDYESFASWPLLYSIGGDERLLDWSLEEWNAITRQWSERGSLRGEFVKHYDMLHTSEGYVGFQYFGLADPRIPENVQRARRFAGFYMNEDSEAPNYDPTYKIIRSPLNGSAGPLYHSEGRYTLQYGHASLYPVVKQLEPGWDQDPARLKEIQKLYDDVILRGDVPMNLSVTGLVTNAYLYTGEDKYKRWVLEYVSAWMDRIRENQGIIPDNIGLTGKIGEYRGGQWWGGFFGWSGRYSVEMIFNSLITAAECALLLSGDPRYLDLLRSQADVLLSRAITRDGDLLVPFKVGPKGWDDYRPLEPHILSHLWHASLDAKDWERIERIRAGNLHGPYAYAYAESPTPPPPDAERWRPDGSKADWTKVLNDVPHRNQNRRNEAPHLLYLAGQNPKWPVEVLEAEYVQVVRCLDRIRSGSFEHIWKSQTVTEQNPVVTNGLAQVTMGAPFTCFNGGLLQAAVRYFDPQRARPGLPENVAALVEKLEASRVVVQLVNLGASQSQSLLVQAGAFGEHQFTEAKADDGVPVKVQSKHVRVELPPSGFVKLELGMRRFANRPSYAFPWPTDSTATP